MTHHPIRMRPLAVAAALALLPLGAALAQTADGEKKDPNDTLALDRVVVTGTSTGASKMKQSVSISTLEFDQIAKQAPTSAAEILRSIPGVRSESSGGEGNANLTVRGVPISAGGARYVQFQEDGLPVLLFGDIAFGTADQFLRADYAIDHLEVIRGGSASTLATNSPGGIINFISRSGEERGGAVGLGLGLAGGRQFRLDANYGGQLGQGTRFHIGGFQRIGAGDRDTGFNAAKGGQIKANVTHDFGSGWVRVSLKALDDRTPTFLPVPVVTTNGTITPVAGIDPRTAFFIGKSFTSDTTLNKDGGLTTSDPRDGLHVRSTALGAELQFNLGDGLSLNNKFRAANNSGRFIGLFPVNAGGGAAVGATFPAVLFNTSIDSLDNLFNDFKLTKVFGGGSEKTTLAGGLFYGKQTVALTWYWNQYTMQSVNSGSTAVQTGTGPTTFGGCCVRNFDVDYTTTSPYASLTWESGPLTVDASVRRDSQRAKGFARQDNAAGTGWDDAGRQNVNYKVGHTSYSAGANYQLSRDIALFGRYSDGVAFSADRLLYGNPLDGSVPVALNEVKQFEAGVKFRSGPFSAFVTVFNARTAESNFEATTQTFTSNRYRANGAELELGYRAGAFRLAGGLTLTDAKITASQTASDVGKTPRRQAKFVYQLSPSYSFGDFEVGAAVIGTGRSWGDDGNTINMPGYTVVNAFANYQINDKLSAQLAVNNLGNTIGWTEVEGDGHAARSINGRTAKLSVKYSF